MKVTYNPSNEERLIDVLQERIVGNAENKVRAKLLDLLELALDRDRFQLMKRNVDNILREHVAYVRQQGAEVLDKSADILARPIHFSTSQGGGGHETPDGWLDSWGISCKCGERFSAESLLVKGADSAEDRAFAAFVEHLKRNGIDPESAADSHQWKRWTERQAAKPLATGAMLADPKLGVVQDTDYCLPARHVPQLAPNITVNVNGQADPKDIAAALQRGVQAGLRSIRTNADAVRNQGGPERGLIK